MTSAPRSPRTWPQYGPASTREASRTRTPASRLATGLGRGGVMDRTPRRSAYKGRRIPDIVEKGATGAGGDAAPLGPLRRVRGMQSANERLGVYRELADTYDRLGQVSMR